MTEKGCVYIGEVLKGQKHFLEEEIEANRWIKSLAAQQDIGRRAAEMDYIDCHIQRTGELFRKYFCHHKCSGWGNCDCRCSKAVDQIFETLKMGSVTPDIKLILDHIGITPEEYLSSYHQYIQDKKEA